MLWLLDHGIKTDNVIFYGFSLTFHFGWRKSMEDMRDDLEKALVGFPFKYDIV
jgi:hypothetical protein